MKKAVRIFLTLSLALSLSAAMVGCNNGNSSTTQNTASQASVKTDSAEPSKTDKTSPDENTSEQSNNETKETEYTLGKIVASGSCGSSVTYELDENGK